MGAFIQGGRGEGKGGSYEILITGERVFRGRWQGPDRGMSEKWMAVRTHGDPPTNPAKHPFRSPLYPAPLPWTPCAPSEIRGTHMQVKAPGFAASGSPVS